jgi:hypothetical protein
VWEFPSQDSTNDTNSLFYFQQKEDSTIKWENKVEQKKTIKVNELWEKCNFLIVVSTVVYNLAVELRNATLKVIFSFQI